MNRYEMYSKRLIWSGAFLLTAVMAGCGGGGGDGGGSPAGPGPGPGPQAGPAHYDFGAAASFGAGSGGGVHNTGLLSAVTGNLGTSAAATTITGLHDAVTGPYTETAANMGSVSGTIFTDTTPAGDAHATADAVVIALTNAMAALSPATATGGTEPNATVPGELGGLTLAPGVYTSAALTITGGDLTLDAQGNPDAFWIFQATAGPLTVGDTSARNVILANGAVAKNVYWWVPGNVVVNAVGGGTMTGSIITQTSLAISSPGAAATSTLNGRAFIFGGAAINMNDTVINTPAP